MEHTPVEILEEIIYLAIPEYDIERRGLLARVSKAWKDVVYGSPRLWAKIDSSHPPAAVRTALKRCQDHLLSFRLSGDTLTPDMYDLVAHEAHRCESIAHSGRNPFPSSQLNRPFIRLRELRLACYTNFVSSSPLPNFCVPNQAMPRLELLVIGGYEPEPCLEVTRWSLQHLELGTTRIPLSKLLKILEATPSLLTLVLARVHVIVDSKRRPVHLPALRFLQISFPGWGPRNEQISHLMQQVRLPNLEKTLRTIHLTKLELSPICLKATGWALRPIRTVLKGRNDIKISIKWLQVICTCPGLFLDWKVNTKTVDLDFLPRFLLGFLPAGAHIAVLQASKFNNHGDPHVQDVVQELQAQYAVQTMVWYRPPTKQTD